MKFFSKLLVAPATAVLLASPALNGFAKVVTKSTVSQSLKGKNNNLIAQVDQKEKINGNIKITVTGTRTERELKNYPGSVSVFDYDYNGSNSFTSWRDYFQYEPGINSQDFLRSDGGRSYAKGDKGNINIRGLEGNRILTQVDGVTIPRFNYGNSTFSVGRLNFIDFNTIGKITYKALEKTGLYVLRAIALFLELDEYHFDKFVNLQLLEQNLLF